MRSIPVWLCHEARKINVRKVLRQNVTSDFPYG